MESINCLTAHIISEEDKLSNWLYSYISERPAQSENTSCNSNSISKCALGALELARNSFFISASLQLPAYINWFCAGGNLVALTGLDYWAGSSFLDDKFPKEVGLEKIFPSTTSLARKAAHVANVGIALLSQVPVAYPAMHYNKEYAIPAGIIVLLGGAFIPLRSMQLYIDKFFNKKDAKEKGIDLEKQEAFVQLIKDNKQYFINKFAAMSQETQKQFFENLQEIRNKVDSKEKIESYWNFLLSTTAVPTEEELSEGSQKATLAAEATGYFFAGTYQLASSVYTFVKTKENIFRNNLFAGAVTVLTVGASIYLEGTATADATVKLVHSIFGINKRNAEFQETLVEKLHKRKIVGLQALGHVTNLLALGVVYVIWDDFFKNEMAKIAFESTSCVAIFLLLQASTPALINELAEWLLLSRNGTPEEKAAVKLSQEYQNLADSIDRISPEDFEKFSTCLPPNLLEILRNGRASNSEESEEGVSLHEVFAINPVLRESEIFPLENLDQV